MNKFKKLSAIILVICSLAAFASCSDKPDSAVTTTAETTTEAVDETTISEVIDIVTEIQTVAVSVTDKKGDVSVSVSEKAVTIPQTVIQAVSDPTKVVNQVTTTKAETTKKVITTVPTTKRPVVDDTINEKAVGISMMTKSGSVQVGDYATVIIMGTPNKTYSIEFYESPSVKMKSDELESQKADENGFVTWSFKVKSSCKAGKRKIVIKEVDSNNYLETSITVR